MIASGWCQRDEDVERNERHQGEGQTARNHWRPYCHSYRASFMPNLSSSEELTIEFFSVNTANTGRIEKYTIKIGNYGPRNKENLSHAFLQIIQRREANMIIPPTNLNKATNTKSATSNKFRNPKKKCVTIYQIVL